MEPISWTTVAIIAGASLVAGAGIAGTVVYYRQENKAKKLIDQYEDKIIQLQFTIGELEAMEQCSAKVIDSLREEVRKLKERQRQLR